MHLSLTTFGNPKPFRTNFPKPVWDLLTFPGGRNPSSVFLLKVLSLWVLGSCPHPLQGLEGATWVSLTRACAAHGDTDSGLHKHNRLKLPNHHTGLKHSPRSRLMTELPGAQTLNQRLARKHNVTSQPISTGWCYCSFETLSPWTTGSPSYLSSSPSWDEEKQTFLLLFMVLGFLALKHRLEDRRPRTSSSPPRLTWRSASVGSFIDPVSERYTLYRV